MKVLHYFKTPISTQLEREFFGSQEVFVNCLFHQHSEVL